MRTTTVGTTIVGLIALLAAAAGAGGTGTITVVATGAASERGTVLIQLANSAADYGSDTGGFRSAEIKPAGGGGGAPFENVPYGDYAVKVFHDENDNKKLDIGLRGPKERYGFSNGARGLFGPPSFADAKVALTTPELQLEIALK
jgi:uncharacterized protein (DUF2141 family)